MNALQGLIEYYRVQLRTDMAEELQYRGALVIWLIGAILEPVIFMVVWSAVARAQGGNVDGLTPGDFAAYFIVGMIVNQLTFTWVMWEFEHYIRNGDLAAALLRPIHPVHVDISENVTYKALTLVVMIPATLLLIWAFDPTWSFSWQALLAFVPALILAFALRFTVEWCLALSAFWTTRTGAVNQLYYTVFVFFSGRLAPLVLFPPVVILLATLLPFRWMLAFPIEVLLGQATGRDLAIGFTAQIVWLALALGLMRVLWRAAVRRFSAVGG